MNLNWKAAVPVVIAVLALVWWFNRDPPERVTEVATFEVAEGDVLDVLREIGELAPQDPTLLQAPFDGEIKWIVEDGSWVEAGGRVIEFEEEALVEQVSQLRASVVDLKQQLRLAKLQADHTRIAERQRVDNAKQDLKLAEIRHRILVTQPTGGNRLVQLDAEIKPVEEALAQLQAILDPLEERFRSSREVYQDALQTWQDARSRLLDLRMGVDLKKSKADDENGEPPPDLDAMKAEVDSLKASLDQARAAHDRDKIPYDQAVAAIDDVDAQAQEIYIQIEIEKRGLPAARLAIDRDVAKLRLAEAERQAASARRALEAGAMSRSRAEQLEADAVAAKGRLEILEYRLEIALRPADEDVIATSEANLATAQRAVDNAELVYEREMGILASEMALLEAQVEQAIGDLERNGKGFPDAIRGTLRMLAAEGELLGAEDGERRAEIAAETAQLNLELVEAERDPPHILRSPEAGLVRLRERDERLTDIGDRWEKGHTVAMLFPPGNMTVQAGINEANFQRVRVGMPVVVRIPALDIVLPDARVSHMSRIGRDREASRGRWVDTAESGIVEFSVTVDLGRNMKEFRQGMTVVFEIETKRVDDVLHVPAAAVQEEADGTFTVLRKGRDRRDSIEGRFFGDDRFVVTDGVSEGDVLVREY